MERTIVPLARRRLDVAIVVFFLVNLLFISYVVDLEQLVIANPYHFTSPVWPPAVAVRAIHWWGTHFDHDLMARPMWWKMTIWIDDLGFGPFYLVALYAYVRGREWIRIPSVVYAAMLLTNVLIILGEEYAGATPTPNFPLVLLANLPWLVFPLLIIYRMGTAAHPFTQPAAAALAATGGAAAAPALVVPRRPSPRQGTFLARFGPWAVVAGASAGLGEEYAAQLAARGLNLVLIARREEVLGALADRLSARHGVRVVPLVLDLARPDAVEVAAQATADLDVGLVVYNAALSVIGPFLERPLEGHLREIAVNCVGPVSFAHRFGARLSARGRGGIVLMSSLSATMGSALIANYAATKAYNLVLAEGLWEELREAGVSVLTCAAGAVSTPNYRESAPRGRGGTQTPAAVVTETLACLGRTPHLVPGAANRLSAFVLRRLLPRPAAIRMMGSVMRGMYGSGN